MNASPVPDSTAAPAFKQVLTRVHQVMVQVETAAESLKNQAAHLLRALAGFQLHGRPVF